MDLELFCDSLSEQTELFLVDANTGDAISSYIESYDGVISWNGRTGANTGFDQNGLFVIDSKSGKEYFRSMRFIQERLPDEEAVSPDGNVFTIHPSLLIDMESRHKYRVDFTLGGENSTEFRIISRALSKNDFYSIEPLKKLFAASIEAGNPIYWC